jgi:hypothetical protein
MNSGSAGILPARSSLQPAGKDAVTPKNSVQGFKARTQNLVGRDLIPAASNKRNTEHQLGS